MTRLILNLTSAMQGMSSKQETLSVCLQESVQIAIQTMNQLREIAHLLHPPALHTMTLPKALEGLFNSYTKPGELVINFDCQSDLPALPDTYSITLYRLAQEALTNIVKHSEAQEVWIRLDSDDGIIRMSVEDNGTGFIPEAVSSGIGLQGLRERFHLLDGSLDIESRPGCGTWLAGYLPIKSSQEEENDTSSSR